MLNYKIENYKFTLLEKEEFKTIFINFLLCGYVTNCDDSELIIPIILEPNTFKGPKSLIPELEGKTSEGIIKDEKRKATPYIIKCSFNDYENLKKNNPIFLVALYHEIGHFHYMDEQNQNSTYLDRVNSVDNNIAYLEDVQADRIPVVIYGKDFVINAFSDLLFYVKFNSKLYNPLELKKFV